MPIYAILTLPLLAEARVRVRVKASVSDLGSVIPMHEVVVAVVVGVVGVAMVVMA